MWKPTAINEGEKLVVAALGRELDQYDMWRDTATVERHVEASSRAQAVSERYLLTFGGSAHSCTNPRDPIVGDVLSVVLGKISPFAPNRVTLPCGAGCSGELRGVEFLWPDGKYASLLTLGPAAVGSLLEIYAGSPKKSDLESVLWTLEGILDTHVRRLPEVDLRKIAGLHDASGRTERVERHVKEDDSSYDNSGRLFVDDRDLEQVTVYESSLVRSNKVRHVAQQELERRKQA